MSGLPDTVSYLDLRRVALKDVADILIAKLHGSETDIRTGPKAGEWVVTFGVNIADIDKQELPPEAPLDRPWLYDWLTQDLVTRVTQGTTLSAARVIEDLRTGETLSVRMRFTWDPRKGALDVGEIAWWELVELSPYEAVYGVRGAP